jgi:adenylylsulfate kinase-like enzyme
VRELLGDAYVEVHVDTPIEVCRDRDPGGLYSAQAAGAAIDLPGVTSPYEVPTDPDLRVSDHPDGADAAADAVVSLLRERGFLRS